MNACGAYNQCSRHMWHVGQRMNHCTDASRGMQSVRGLVDIIPKSHGQHCRGEARALCAKRTLTTLQCNRSIASNPASSTRTHETHAASRPLEPLPALCPPFGGKSASIAKARAPPHGHCRQTTCRHIDHSTVGAVLDAMHEMAHADMTGAVILLDTSQKES